MTEPLLRRSIGRRRLRQVEQAVEQPAREAHVHDLGLVGLLPGCVGALGEDDVRGPEVPEHDTLLVSVVDAACDELDQVQRRIRRQRALRRNETQQGVALDPLQHKEREALGQQPAIAQGDHARVREAARPVDLDPRALKEARTLVRRDLGQHEDHGLVRLQVTGRVGVPDRPAIRLLQDAVSAVDDGVVDELGGLTRGGNARERIRRASTAGGCGRTGARLGSAGDRAFRSRVRQEVLGIDGARRE